MSLALLSLLASVSQAAVTTSHGFTRFGELKHGPEVTAFDYMNPDARPRDSIEFRTSAFLR